MISRIAATLDRIGLRRPLALAATLAYKDRRFEVDRKGRWLNRQAEATFVSQTLHTSPYSRVEAWVIDNWGWDYLPGQGDVLVDVGAGIGEETVVFSKLVGPTGRVISIEAHPETFEDLTRTVSLSGCENVTVVHCALTSQDGSVSIATGEHHVASSIINGGGAQVAARSLDSLLAELGVAKVDFIKMNIEGAETLALRGMTHWLGRARAACVSCHDFIADLGGSDDFRTREAVRGVLQAAGYHLRDRPEHVDCWVRDYLYARLPEDK